MSSPSAPLLQRLRDLAQQRQATPSTLAQQTGLPRDRVQEVMAGRTPMTVDELILLTQALELEPDDLGLGSDADYDPPVAPVAPVDTPDGSIADLIDPFGNHARQIFEVGFSLGCDFFFRAAVDQLADSGVPASVLARYEGGDLPIKLDAQYHTYNEPRFERGGLWLKLSFDDIYACFFPWASFRQIVFFPAAPPVEEEPEPEPEEPPPGKPRAPFLRLVE